MEIFICVVSLLNLLLLIAIAGTLTKIVELLTPKVPQNLIDLDNRPSYDLESFRGKFYDGISERPRNWDGVARLRE